MPHRRIAKGNDVTAPFWSRDGWWEVVVFLTSNLEARGAIGQLQKAPLLPTGAVGIRGTGSVALVLAWITH